MKEDKYKPETREEKDTYHMEAEEFNKNLNEQIESLRNLLERKGDEYAKGINPLNNFITASNITGEPASRIAYNYMLKHFVSITDMIKEPTEHAYELWKEKLGDMKAYLFLIEMLVSLELNRADNE